MQLRTMSWHGITIFFPPYTLQGEAIAKFVQWSGQNVSQHEFGF